MDVTVANACGLDVHEALVVACVLIGDGPRPSKTIRTFSTMRRDLLALREWLVTAKVTHVVMEGTGIYWRPVYETLEGAGDALDIAVVNARHVKNVPGRKSDVMDAEWLARLLRSGLLRKSFVPAPAIRALRDLSRYRRMLVQAQTTEKNRILKLVETMGIKLAAVASDVFGTSGTAMLEAIAEGTKSIEQIAQLARSALRQKLPELRLALECTVQSHHRMMLQDQLARLRATGAEIAKYDRLLQEQSAPYTEWLELLGSIDGVKRTAAIEIFAEIGPNLACFPRESNFASWAGTSPGLHESAGKKKRGRRRRGNPYLTSILVECALAATRKKGTYLSDKYRRLKARRPALVALFAIANKLAGAVYRAITTRVAYRDLGAAYLDRRNPTRTARTLVQRLRDLGLDRDALLQLLPASSQSPA
jgi:transposase